MFSRQEISFKANYLLTTQVIPLISRLPNQCDCESPNIFLLIPLPDWCMPHSCTHRLLPLEPAFNAYCGTSQVVLVPITGFRNPKAPVLCLLSRLNQQSQEAGWDEGRWTWSWAGRIHLQSRRRLSQRPQSESSLSMCLRIEPCRHFLTSSSSTSTPESKKLLNKLVNIKIFSLLIIFLEGCLLLCISEFH